MPTTLLVAFGDPARTCAIHAYTEAAIMGATGTLHLPAGTDLAHVAIESDLGDGSAWTLDTLADRPDTQVGLDVTLDAAATGDCLLSGTLDGWSNAVRAPLGAATTLVVIGKR